MNRERRLSVWIPLAAALGILAPRPAAAETGLRVEGEVRARAEADRRDFDPAAPAMQYSDLRTRIAVEAIREGNARVFVQFQDSRRLGGRDGSGNPASGTLNGGSNVDVHQAFVRIDRLGADGLHLQAGRYEVNLGNQRVFGAVGWHNVGRAWEGVSLGCGASENDVTLHWLKGLERNDPDGNTDHDIVGLDGRFPGAGLELFAFLERNGEELTVDEAGTTENRLRRYDLGGYFRREFGAFGVEANGVYQLGERAVENGDFGVLQEISAFLATAEVSYRVPGEKKIRLAAGADYASGDSDTGDDTFEAYDNLYYTGHKFRGSMDYFIGSETTGLLDLVARCSMEAAPGWILRADLHHFRTAEEFIGFEGEKASSLGYEIDVTATTTRVAGVRFDGGASLFLSSDEYAGMEDHDPGLWAFTMMTVEFGVDIP